MTRSTVPTSVSGNGAGNVSVSVSARLLPVRYAAPFSAVGYSGELAVTDPTGLQLLTGVRHSRPSAPRLGARTDVGNVSAIERLGAAVADAVMFVVSATALSPASRCALTENCGS